MLKKMKEILLSHLQSDMERTGSVISKRTRFTINYFNLQIYEQMGYFLNAAAVLFSHHDLESVKTDRRRQKKNRNEANG
jgi:hypothetical protein